MCIPKVGLARAVRLHDPRVCVCVRHAESRRAQALEAAELPTFLQGGAHAAELLTEHAGQTHHETLQLARRHLHEREGGGTGGRRDETQRGIETKNTKG